VVVRALGEVYIHADHCRRKVADEQPGEILFDWRTFKSRGGMAVKVRA
jgi:hypothetical protein